MANILIISHFSDTHADAVQWHLERLGNQVVRLDLSGFPHETTHTVLLDDSLTEERINHVEKEYTLNQDFDAVWLRRANAPNVNKELLDPDDFFVADKLCRAHCKAILNDLTLGKAFWINKLEASNVADSKQAQLKAALRIGLSVPKTLISNRPQDIKHFIQANLPNKTVYKDIEAIAWPELLNRPVVSRTTFIEESGLPDENILKAVPGIFQREVNKQFEVRTVVMGHQVFAIKINSQLKESGSLDWREIPFEQMSGVTSHYDLPLDIVEKSLLLMDELGICFGCFDFIVDESGEHIFIEVNEQGQFLWMEELVPELPLLEAFCEFLTSKNPEYQFAPRERLISFNHLLENDEFIKYAERAF